MIEPIRSGESVRKYVNVQSFGVFAERPPVVVTVVIAPMAAELASGFEVHARHAGIRILFEKERIQTFEEFDVRSPSGIEMAFHVPRIPERRFDMERSVELVNAYAISPAYDIVVFRIEFFFGEQIRSSESLGVFRKVGTIPFLQSGNEFLRIDRSRDPEEVAAIVSHVSCG